MRIKNLLYNTSKAHKHLKIATVAMKCHENPEDNLKKMSNFVKEIKKEHPQVELIVFGETITGWFFNFEKTAEYHHKIAETIPGKTTNLMSDLAKNNNLYICFGLNEIKENKYYNSQVLVNPEGEIIAVHRKVKMRETFFSPGDVLVTIVNIKDIKTGLVICYDVQYKEVNKTLRKSNLELIIHSLADDEDPREFGIGYLSRSYNAWLINANRYGKEGGHFWNGWLTITNPLGEICLKGKDKEQYLYYEIGFIKKQKWFAKNLRITYVKIARIVHVIKNIDMALATIINRFKVKKEKEKNINK